MNFDFSIIHFHPSTIFVYFNHIECNLHTIDDDDDDEIRTYIDVFKLLNHFN